MHPSLASILEFFEYDHLPASLQLVSKPFHELAHQLVTQLRDTQAGAELTTSLRKLLEAKDCAVRAALKL